MRIEARTAPPRLLLVGGSPRAGGNTDTLLQAAAEGFREAGGEADFLFLREQRIEDCRGCLACLEQLPRPCVQRDDMDAVYDRLLAADALVLGTPIYFWGPTALMKSFLDRWFPFGDWQKTGYAKALDKPAGLVMVYADQEPLGSGVELTYRQLRITVKCTGGTVAGMVHGTAEHPGDIQKNPEKLDAARRLGRELYLKVRD